MNESNVAESDVRQLAISRGIFEITSLQLNFMIYVCRHRMPPRVYRKSIICRMSRIDHIASSPDNTFPDIYAIACLL